MEIMGDGIFMASLYSIYLCQISMPYRKVSGRWLGSFAGFLFNNGRATPAKTGIGTQNLIQTRGVPEEYRSGTNLGVQY